MNKDKQMDTKRKASLKALGIFGLKPDNSPAFKHLIRDLEALLDSKISDDMLSYYAVRQMVFDWLEGQGDKKRFGGKPTKKGNALYYYNQAMKYGDLDAAHRYLKKYYKFGGIYKRPTKTTKCSHPLSSIPTIKRITFRRSLTQDQEVVLKRVLNWYNNIYK